MCFSHEHLRSSPLVRTTKNYIYPTYPRETPEANGALQTKYRDNYGEFLIEIQFQERDTQSSFTDKIQRILEKTFV